MDPKHKIVVAVAAGVVIGLTLFGGALASHALVRAVATGAPAHASQAMPGPRGGQMGAPQACGACPNGEACAEGARPDCGACDEGGACQGDEVCGNGACPEGQRPMMDPRGGCPNGEQGGMGGCPDGGPCPDVTDGPTTES